MTLYGFAKNPETGRIQALADHRERTGGTCPTRSVRREWLPITWSDTRNGFRDAEFWSGTVNAVRMGR